MSRIHIPFVTPTPLDFGHADTIALIRRAIFAHDIDPMRLDESITRMGGQVIADQWPAITLEAFDRHTFNIYHGTLMNRKFNRFVIATALGHFILHFLRIAHKLEATGLQVVNDLDHALATPENARIEAIWFANELLMPEEHFRTHFNAGGIDQVCLNMDVTKKHALHRATSLGLRVPQVA